MMHRLHHFGAGLALCSLLVISPPSPARTGQPAASPYTAGPLTNDQAMQRTRQLERQLGLSEQQFIRLLPLTRLYLAQRALIDQQSGGQLGTHTARLAQLEADYEQAYRYLLTPRQLALLPAGPVAAPRFDLGMAVSAHP